MCAAKVFVLSASFFSLKRHTGNGFLSWKYCYVYIAHIPRESCYVLFTSSFTVRVTQYRLWSCFQPQSHITVYQSRVASEQDPILFWLITASNCMSAVLSQTRDKQCFLPKMHPRFRVLLCSEIIFMILLFKLRYCGWDKHRGYMCLPSKAALRGNTTHWQQMKCYVFFFFF